MNIRLRKDLNITKRIQGLDAVWILKDPVSFAHFQFSEHEFFLAKLFDGKRNVEEVVQRWRERFKSASLSVTQVQSFVQRLIGDNLVVVEKAGYGGVLENRDGLNRGSLSRKWFANPLAIRFRGVNPSAFLKEFDWLGRLFFHPVTVVMCLISASLVLLFMLCNFESVAQRIPRIEELLATKGVVGLVVTLVIVKVLHELGHAMACRRYGGECLEIGVILLALIPTLYCNVSDAWSIAERWKRMMVSFAGMYVEICLASVAAVVWFMTPPGTLLNALLFNIVVLCSISTVLINGNPLLRYDGYYLLSDWIEKPNLSEAANRELNGCLSSLVFKSQSSQGNSSSGRESGLSAKRWLLLYAVCSFVYRWFVVGAILYAGLLFAFKWQAGMLGGLAAGALLLTMVGGKLKRMTTLFASSAVSWIRLSLTVVVAGGLLWFVLFLPFPKNVYGEFEVTLKNSVPVFSPLDGRLVFIADPYESVKEGETLLRLENAELENDVTLKGLELERAKNELKLLESRINEADSIASQVEIAKKNVEAVQASYELLNGELERLVVVAKIDGTIYPAPVDRPEVGTLETGLPLVDAVSFSDPAKKNCFVRASRHLLTVSDSSVREIVMFVDEGDMDLVEVGQKVRLNFDRIKDRQFPGSIVDVFENELETNLDNEVGPTKIFRVVVQVPEIPAKVVAGSGGRAKVSVPSESLGARGMRALKQALNNRL